MRLDGDSGFLKFEESQVGDGSDPDLLLNVTANLGNYSAADQCWIAATDLLAFCDGLRQLEARRQGQAVLVGASPEDLRLQFYSIDSLGHMAVKGHIGWPRSEEFPLQLKFGFEFEPHQLLVLLEFFQGLVRR